MTKYTLSETILGLEGPYEVLAKVFLVIQWNGLENSGSLLGIGQVIGNAPLGVQDEYNKMKKESNSTNA